MAAAVAGGPRIRLVWSLFGGFSLAALLVGCLAAGAQGTAARAWGLNIAAWLVGAGLAAGVARLKRETAPGWLALAIAALALTLVSPGLSGVHRWFSVGPVRLNAAELLAPIAVAACAGLDRASWSRLLFPPAIAALLAFQPDVSQAAAVAAAGLALAATSNRPGVVRALVALGLAAAVVAAALRPDPLGPVADVEGIVGLAAAISPIVAALGMAAIAGAVLTPLVLAGAQAPRVRDAALSLALYLTVTALAPAAGAFPVPLMGMGVSPILGAWLAIGWLAGLVRRSPP